MSAYYNNLFRADPFRFINTYSVDIKGWFEGLMRHGDGMSRALVQAANAAGVCRLDFDPVGGFFGFGVNTVQVQMIPQGGIDAYWVPYHAGHGLPGFTDVLRLNPPSKFVFTAGMNGCAFVVTDSPKGVAYMRVYHNQHPNVDSIWNDIHNVGMPVISYSGFEDYGGGALPNGMNPVAFNFLYYRNGTWNYVFQPQAFNALSKNPARRLIGQSSMRSVF
ncbi:hypothetical protein DSCO28_23000 [Desulfosarcina ovata subsp. sediminis]|uniref:Uncharacterized protein n=1 Tax=Desulfosarcina ovata subsp. sediminis TaxID=885957 RepID=A0A5K7ZK25_9BACT|nr:hypothetical protein [Desulfosarcina ovata]BBO81734.1 hypothetical protein DSCO28_23000 [Desulfosarcina ovata subsp. sediminis]